MWSWVERAVGKVSMKFPGCRFGKVFVSEKGWGKVVWSLVHDIFGGGSPSRFLSSESVPMRAVFFIRIASISFSLSQTGLPHFTSLLPYRDLCLLWKAAEWVSTLWHLWEDAQSNLLRVQREMALFVSLLGYVSKGCRYKSYTSLLLLMQLSWLNNSDFHSYWWMPSLPMPQPSRLEVNRKELDGEDSYKWSSWFIQEHCPEGVTQ